MSKRAEEFAVRIHNTALRKAKKHASEHGMGVLGEVSYGWGFKAGAIAGYEQAEKDLGWISVKDKLPEERKYESDNLQGHHEWAESERVLVWDSTYGPGIDWTRNGKWRSEQTDGYQPQICHGIIAWMTIPEFKEEEVWAREQKKWH